MEDKTPQIYKTIIAVMKEIGAIEKDDTNDFQKYKFRGIDAVYNKLHPIMSKHSIFVYPEVIGVDRTPGTKGFCTILTIKYTFVCAIDGSTLESVVVGEAADSSDKSCNKAMSAAIKYLFFQVFCIPTEGTPDADKDTPDVTPGKKPKTTTKNFEFLTYMSEHKKRLGDEIYYTVLGDAGYKHANLIIKREHQEDVFKKLNALQGE